MPRVIATSSHNTLLTAQDQTRAIARYARTHDLFASTVRADTQLRGAAFKLWADAHPETLMRYAVYSR